MSRILTLISVLSHFNSLKGPEVFIDYPACPDFLQIDHIPMLMDFYDKGFFIHKFGQVDTANYIFQLESPLARGNKELLMITLVLFEEDYDLASFKKFLKIFVRDLQSIEDIYKAFHKPKEEDFNESYTAYKKIKLSLENFHKSLPIEKAIFKIRKTKILIIGLAESGRSSLIDYLKNVFFSQETLNSERSIIKNLLGNLSIITYNILDNVIMEKLPSIYFDNIDGIIFMLDSSNKAKMEEAFHLLHRLNEFPQIHRLPLLLLFNKMDKNNVKESELISKLKINELKYKNSRHFSVSIINEEGIVEAIYWLSKEISNKFLKNPKQALL